MVDIADAIWLANEHRKQQAGTKRRGWQMVLPSIEAVLADTLRKAAALRRVRDVKKTS